MLIINECPIVIRSSVIDYILYNKSVSQSMSSQIAQNNIYCSA